MNNLDNLKSYDDVENLMRFSSKTFAEYCEMKLKTAEKNKRFIMEHCINACGGGMQVCEIGSGNSKLLYSLDKEGIIDKAVGYEVSESRWKFAEKFKEYMGAESHVENRNENMLESKSDETYDVIIAVDIVTQIIVSLYDNAEEEYFAWIEKHLKKEGYVLFEICSFSKELEYIRVHNGPYLFWEEFPQEDPFQYGLYSCKKDSDNNIVWEKRFFEKRTREFSEFKNVIRPYSENDFLEILNKHHMRGEVYHCYKELGDLDEEGSYLVVAQKI